LFQSEMHSSHDNSKRFCFTPVIML